MEKKHTLVYGIKGKLISALCMLLVAMIMVVSSTYAWFTLSTAPEITGISTTIGANGALEMLLATKDASGNWVYGEGVINSADWETKNTYWGNLVDVSDDTVYGLNLLNLYPAKLNLSNGELVLSSPLVTPSYGSDGRVTGTKENTVFGLYDKTEQVFYQVDNQYGVRAIGVASGMTNRQLSYRNTLGAAQSAMAAAKNAASASLNSRGATLANLALKKATETSSTVYTGDDIAALQAIVGDLTATDGIIAKIEAAYLNYFHAFAASSLVADDTDLAYAVIQSQYDSIDDLYAANGTITVSVTPEGGTATSVTATLPEGFTTALAALKATKDDVLEAEGMLNTLSGIVAAGGTIAWSSYDTDGNPATTDDVVTTLGISTPLYKLADTDSMEINGIKASEIKKDNNMSTIVNAVASGGLKVTMKSGGGVYADIADHCGDYSASITISEVSYGGLTVGPVTARMNTESALSTSYLTAVNTVVKDKAPASRSAEDGMPLTEFYGYVLDLAFKTNASSSNLMLEIDGTDRIYSDNTAGLDTQGSGSNMIFKAAETATDMSDEMVKDLMRAVRIVIYETAPSDGTAKIYAYARLDVDNATTGADGIKASLKICDVNGDPLKNDQGVELTAEEANKLLALTANTAAHVSTLVYLDGEVITNSNVTAIGATSVTSEMNIQFKSDANLVPMKDGTLYNPSASETTAAPSETTGN